MNNYLGIKPTGFCWKCGLPIGTMVRGRLVFGISEELFCNKKHEEQYRRQLKSAEHTGKKDGYGLAGSTH